MKTAKEKLWGRAKSRGRQAWTRTGSEVQEDIFQRDQGETRKDFEICGWLTALESSQSTGGWVGGGVGEGRVSSWCRARHLDFHFFPSFSVEAPILLLCLGETLAPLCVSPGSQPCPPLPRLAQLVNPSQL